MVVLAVVVGVVVVVVVVAVGSLVTAACELPKVLPPLDFRAAWLRLHLFWSAEASQ